MADQYVFVTNFAIGAQGTANVPLFRGEPGFGGYTILGAYMRSGAAATITGNLLNMGTSLGTTASSTVGTFSAAVGTLVANVQKAITITTPYQADGTWLGFQDLTGIPDAGFVVNVEWKYGK